MARTSARTLEVAPITTNAEEVELRKDVSEIEQLANAIVITNDADYQEASDICSQVKTTKQNVVDYWEPIRKPAYDAYNTILKHKKDMTDPLDKAEKTLKAKMVDYNNKMELERRIAEANARKAAQAEVDRLVEEADAALKAGDTALAEQLLAEAEMYDVASTTLTVAGNKPEANGSYTTKAWTIKVTDAAKVPVSVNGVEIRPVDEAAVLKLVKAMKGNITIPGIEIEETCTVAVRKK
ncbi:MAG: hypothetical protein LUE27_06695 [Clostridia bacterium]|nr:hypothetical protein [Clostridia bacterium]